MRRALIYVVDLLGQENGNFKFLFTISLKNVLFSGTSLFVNGLKLKFWFQEPICVLKLDAPESNNILELVVWCKVIEFIHNFLIGFFLSIHKHYMSKKVSNFLEIVQNQSESRQCRGKCKFLISYNSHITAKRNK